MELTLNQALQKGIEAHMAGQVQEADRLYTTILKAQPEHPDANYNMGVLAVSVGKVQEALPFFKIALEANPSIAQFWLTYIDALIKLDRLSDAKAVLDQAKDNGATGEAFDQFEKWLNVPKELIAESVFGSQEVEKAQPNILDTLKLDQAINLAKKKSKKGYPEEAKRIYQDILVKFPKNKRAIDGIKALSGGPVGRVSKVQESPQGQVQSIINLYNQGQLAAVVEQAQALIEQYPETFIVWNILGAAAAQIGKLDLATIAFQKAITIKPDNAGAYYNMGNALREQCKLEEAIDAYNTALTIKPDYAECYSNMGVTLKEQGKLEKAIEAYNKALAIKPDYADAYNMGDALKEQGKLEDAIKAYNKALAIKPDYAEAYNNMGNAIKEQGKWEEAIEAYNKALAFKPDYAEAYNNMGSALQEQGKLEDAINAYNKALAIKPDYANAYNNLGNALQEQGKLENAIKAYNKALAIKPDYVKAYNNIGFVLQEQGKPEEAIESYNKALVIKPDDADAFYNMSFCKLQTVDWKEGIALRSMRINMKHFRDYARDFNAPHWDGTSSLEGKTLLIWGEQGPGDMIIWASCFEYYISKCCKVIVECSPKLIRLFQLSFPRIEFRAERKNVKNNTEDFDYQVPMETLFGYACSSGFSNNEQKQYLYPDQERVNYWSNRLKLISDKPCVGISWKSPVMNVKRAKNYANLSYWRPVFKNTNVTFVNLQSTDFQKDLNKIHRDFGTDVVHFGEINHYDDLAEVAALSKALDMSISIATAVATITAGVGTTTIIPTWRQSSWNNLLFNSRGPDLEMLYRNSWENWDKTFNKVAEKVSCLLQ